MASRQVAVKMLQKYINGCKIVIVTTVDAGGAVMFDKTEMVLSRHSEGTLRRVADWPRGSQAVATQPNAASLKIVLLQLPGL